MKELAATISLSVHGQKSFFDSDKCFVAPETQSHIDTPQEVIELDCSQSQLVEEKAKSFGVTINPSDPNASLGDIIIDNSEQFYLDDNGYLINISAPNSPTEDDLLGFPSTSSPLGVHEQTKAQSPSVHVIEQNTVQPQSSTSASEVVVGDVKPAVDVKPNADNLLWAKYSANLLRTKRN